VLVAHYFFYVSVHFLKFQRMRCNCDTMVLVVFIMTRYLVYFDSEFMEFLYPCVSGLNNA
jgi:hypothetical protein